jgi:hypothetical protein
MAEGVGDLRYCEHEYQVEEKLQPARVPFSTGVLKASQARPVDYSQRPHLLFSRRLGVSHGSYLIAAGDVQVL